MNIDELVNNILLEHGDLPLNVNTNIYNFILKIFKSYEGSKNDLNRIYNLIMSSNVEFKQKINKNCTSMSIINESCTSFTLSYDILSRLKLLSDFQTCKHYILFFTAIEYLMNTYDITKIHNVIQCKDDEIQILLIILNAAFYYSKDYLKKLNLDCRFKYDMYNEIYDILEEELPGKTMHSKIEYEFTVLL